MLVIRWIFSSIVNEVIKTIYLFFYEDILHTKKAYKAPNQRLLRYFLYA